MGVGVGGAGGGNIEGGREGGRNQGVGGRKERGKWGHLKLTSVKIV